MRVKSTSRVGGFTLIELMITVVIVSILATIAYPSYVEQVRKTRRSDAQTALLRSTQSLERCYTEYNAYNDTSCAAVAASGTDLAATYQGTQGGYYTLGANSLTPLHSHSKLRPMVTRQMTSAAA